MEVISGQIIFKVMRLYDITKGMSIDKDEKRYKG